MQALQRFQKQEADFLVATDLAARGLDLCNVETVINFHLPLDISRYIHRVGRTARMGRAGRAVTIYCPEEYSKVKQLGRQCCSEVKSKVLKRTVASSAVEHWAAKIESLKDDIEGILQEDSLDRELRFADILSGKADNLQKHKSTIQSRPAKEWYITNADKHRLKVEEATRLKEAEEETSALVGAEKRKRDAILDPAEQAEAKRKQRAKDRYRQKKALEKAEREQDERRQRAAARFRRHASRPLRVGSSPAVAEQPQQKGKVKRRTKAT